MCIRDRGSMLSELLSTLFITAINDISKGIEAHTGKKFLYIDDLALFYLSSSTAIIKFKLQRVVNKIKESTEKVHFCFSVTKTTCVQR